MKDSLVQPKNLKRKKDVKNEIVDGHHSFLARYQAELLNQLDPETFLRHSEISDTLHIRLDFLRDFKNCLSLLSKEDHCDFTEELEKDSSRMVIAKLATREFHQANMMANQKS